MTQKSRPVEPQLPRPGDSYPTLYSQLESWGASERQVQIVWDAIALHMHASIAMRKGPEASIVTMGAGLDVAGLGVDVLDPDKVGAILAAYPRLNLREAAFADILGQLRRKPYAYLMHPWAEIGHAHIEDFPLPTVEEILFGDNALEDWGQ